MSKVLRNNKLSVSLEKDEWCLNSFDTVRHQWKIRIELVIFAGCVQACPVMHKVGAQMPVYLKWQIANISLKSWVIVLIFFIHSDINGSYKLTQSFLLGVVRYVMTLPECSKITSCQYLWKEVSECLNTSHAVRYQWKLLIDFATLLTNKKVFSS